MHVEGTSRAAPLGDGAMTLPGIGVTSMDTDVAVAIITAGSAALIGSMSYAGRALLGWRNEQTQRHADEVVHGVPFPQGIAGIVDEALDELGQPTVNTIPVPNP
jgi:hypothetical protein